ncbi:MAG: hypothetical protein WEG36_06205 [Gemmatimonadota bacterium]
MASSLAAKMRRVMALRRMVREASRSYGGGPVEGTLLRTTVLFSLIVAQLSEQHRHRTKESGGELAAAYLCLVAATILRGIARLAVRDRARFREALLETRRTVLPRMVKSSIPLVVVGVLWKDEDATIVHTKCLQFPHLYLTAGRHVHFLVSASWAKFSVSFLWHRVVRVLEDPWDRVDRATWLGNSPAEVRAAAGQKCRSTFVNANCFINELRLGLVLSNGEPRYDAVLCANAGRWKRHYLARDVKSLAYITYSRDEEGRLLWPEESFQPAYMNDHYLDEWERSEIFAQSGCGLTLSSCEGQNNATVEYLLSGLPVVSTPSIGGRDIWFTEDNAIVCDSTPEAVARAVEVWKERRSGGAIDGRRIRDECLKRMAEHRARFVEALQDVFARAGLSGDASQVFQALREEDRMLHALSFQRSESPNRHPFAQGSGWYPLDALPF